RNKTGRSSYNFTKKVQLALSAVTSFSARPLYLIFVLGLIVSLISVLVAIVLVVAHVQGLLVPGWASIVLSILFTGRLTNFSVGMLGIYLGRIYIQSKNRPLYFIEKEVSHDAAAATALRDLRDDRHAAPIARHGTG